MRPGAPSVARGLAGAPASAPAPTVRRLTGAADAAPFVPLAHGSVRPLLDRLAPIAGLVVVGAEADGRPIGLGVGLSEGAAIRVLWLYVVPEARGSGLGRRLLDAVEAAARGDGAQHLVGRWLEGRPSTPAVERLVAAWDDPRHRATIYRVHDADAAVVVRLPWVLDPPSRPGYDLFAWSTLSDAERQRVEAELASGELTATATFDPFLPNRFPVDPDLSVGIRYGGRVVGWMINRKMGPGVTFIDRLWLEPEHQWTAGSIAALAWYLREGERLHSGIPGWGGVWITAADNRPMMAFNDRRLAPHATRVSRQFEASKPLGDA